MTLNSCYSCRYWHLLVTGFSSFLEIIISGGVSSIDDIKNAKNLNKNIEGIIVGKAIYDGDIKLDELAREIDA